MFSRGDTEPRVSWRMGSFFPRLDVNLSCHVMCDLTCREFLEQRDADCLIGVVKYISKMAKAVRLTSPGVNIRWTEPCCTTKVPVSWNMLMSSSQTVLCSNGGAGAYVQSEDSPFCCQFLSPVMFRDLLFSGSVWSLAGYGWGQYIFV
jgi:hypothetical protein